MTRHEHDENRTDALDHQWDHDLDGVARSDNLTSEPAHLIAALHRRDDTPGTSDDFRQRLETALREQHPAGTTVSMPDSDDIEPQTASTPLRETEASGVDRTGSFTRPSTLRQWGELAAMVAILSLAIVGAALFGDDAYDYAQRTLLSSDDDAVDVSDLREALDEMGEVENLTLEEAQALTPYELAEPSIIPGEYEIVGWSVQKAHVDRRGQVFWTVWRSTMELVPEDDAGPSILLHQRPAAELVSVPLPYNGEVAGGTGRLQVVQINDIGAVEVLTHTEENGDETYYLWQQGGVDVWIQIPFDITGDASLQASYIEMLASIIDQGPLDDGTEVITHRGMSLDQLRATMPTVPVADPTPEHLVLTRADNLLYGPLMHYEHNDDDVRDIWVRGVGGTVSPSLLEALEQAGAQMLQAGDTPVARQVLSDRFAPETAEFIETVRLHTDLLLPWISSDSDTALVVYLWDIAGMSYLMGVEVSHDRLNANAREATIDGDLPEQDWLDLGESQRAFADEHLNPHEIFPVLARQETEEDQPPVSFGGQVERSRLIGTTDRGQYYLANNPQRNLYMVYQFIDVREESEPRSSGGGAPLWSAAEYGIGIEMSGGGGYHVAWVLPQGYDEVVDENGELIAEVEDQLFAVSYEMGEARPRSMTARGPAGELSLDMGAGATDDRIPPDER